MENKENNLGIFKELTDKITAINKENCALKLEVQSVQEAGHREMMETLRDIISIFDVFERAKTLITEKGWDASEEGQKVRDRFLNVEKQLIKKLEQHGVKEIPIEIGSVVDDFLCSVCDTEPDQSRENDTIIAVEKKGYTYKGAVLRPADVIIVKN